MSPTPSDKPPKAAPPVVTETDDDLDALDNFGPYEGQEEPHQGTVVASIPVFLNDDEPHVAREKGASMASMEIAPLPPGIRASLEFEDASGPAFQLSKTVTMIGRAGGAADLVLPWNEEASRQHCALLFAAGAFFLEDLRSSNGTFVNENPVERVRIRSGDKIRIGTQVLVFQYKL